MYSLISDIPLQKCLLFIGKNVGTYISDDIRENRPTLPEPTAVNS